MSDWRITPDVSDRTRRRWQWEVSTPINDPLHTSQLNHGRWRLLMAIDTSTRNYSCHWIDTHVFMRPGDPWDYIAAVVLSVTLSLEEHNAR